MAFSPETYVLLQAKTGNYDARITQLESSVAELITLTNHGVYAKDAEILTTSMITHLEEVYQNQRDNDAMSGTIKESTYDLTFIGTKRTASPVNRFIGIITGTGGSNFMLINRNNTTSAWSGRVIGILGFTSDAPWSKEDIIG